MAGRGLHRSSDRDDVRGISGLPCDKTGARQKALERGIHLQSANHRIGPPAAQKAFASQYLLAGLFREYGYGGFDGLGRDRKIADFSESRLCGDGGKNCCREDHIFSPWRRRSIAPFPLALMHGRTFSDGVAIIFSQFCNGASFYIRHRNAAY
ncbi:hypothetical protein WG907_00380 [Sphingobium sp. AN558]|uniref:hypothetical protein n=1 Tax=Sphingobium sp. AN558 TaxID=3133442 RepID=UPI0030BB8E45